jgi:hypothetical protein
MLSAHFTHAKQQLEPLFDRFRQSGKDLVGAAKPVDSD